MAKSEAKRAYKVTHGVHGLREKGGELKVHQPGDIIELTEAQARARQGQVEPAGGGASASDDGDVEANGEQVHGMTVDEATELVDNTEDAAELDRLEKAEKANPKHKGGRAGVLNAIDRRRGEL